MPTLVVTTEGRTGRYVNAYNGTEEELYAEAARKAQQAGNSSHRSGRHSLFEVR